MSGRSGLSSESSFARSLPKFERIRWRSSPVIRLEIKTHRCRKTRLLATPPLNTSPFTS